MFFNLALKGVDSKFSYLDTRFNRFFDVQADSVLSPIAPTELTPSADTPVTSTLRPAPRS